jgi:NAD(P)-dependent dehydrogenase (short-subunit alcohol dehydrogenase family)
MIGTAAEAYGSLDVLVNNAGIMDSMEPIDATTNQQWERVLGVNLNGVFFASRLASQHMLKRGQGAIVNIASVGGLFGGRAGAAYTASKHAVVGLTRNMAFMYADKGIRTNAIAPGAVATNIAKSMGAPHPVGAQRMQLGFATSPRPADPDTIAHLALFLASREASNVNGAVITADGGWTAY